MEGSECFLCKIKLSRRNRGIFENDRVKFYLLLPNEM